MFKNYVDDLNIVDQKILITPNQLQKELPISALAQRTVEQGRTCIKNILERKDERLVVVVGPCSIHDPKAAIEYATRLKVLADQVKDSLLIVMRVYFEKPRTSVGWKGLINDPYLNDTYQVEEGLRIARKLLIDIAEMGLPIATEALDPISSKYIQDFISWSAIGARTTESQTHREMASGLSSVVGFKNSMDGSITAAVNSLKSVSTPHRFLDINKEGHVSMTHAKGNNYGHIVLRGGDTGPNYDSISVEKCEELINEYNFSANIMIDCSHANSDRDYQKQPLVINNIVSQIIQGNDSIIGMMIESNLEAGNQKISDSMAYGVSITDACIDWQTTGSIIQDVATRLKSVLPKRSMFVELMQQPSTMANVVNG